MLNVEPAIYDKDNAALTDPSLLVDPLKPINSPEDAVLRLRVHNLPPWDICGLEDLRCFLNGVAARALNLDMFLKYHYGSAIPEPGSQTPEPPGTLPAPVLAAGSLNVQSRTCLIDCSFPMVAKTLLGLQGIPCLGTPLIFTRDQTPFLDEAIATTKQKAQERKDARCREMEEAQSRPQKHEDDEPDDGAEALAMVPTATKSTEAARGNASDSDEEADIQFSDEETPEPITENTMFASLMTRLANPEVSERVFYITGVRPFTKDADLLEYIKGRLDIIQGTGDTYIEMLWLAKDRRMNTNMGIGLVVISRNIEMVSRIEGMSSSELEKHNAKEKILMRSTVEGLSRDLCGKLFEGYKLFAVPLYQFVNKSLDHKQQVARVYTISPYKPTHDYRAISVMNYNTELFFKYSTTSTIYADHLLMGLLQQRSLKWGQRPSKVLQISGLIFAYELISKAELQELLVDLLHVAGQYGQVSLVSVVRSYVEFDEGEPIGNIRYPHGCGKVFLEFQDLFGARKAQYNMNGLRFDHTQFISVSFYPENLYSSKCFVTYSDIIPERAEHTEPTCFIPRGNTVKEVEWGSRGLATVPDIEDVQDEKEVVEEEVPCIHTAREELEMNKQDGNNGIL